MHEPERNTAYEVVVVRAGAFVREVDGVSSFAHSGVLTLSAPGEVHRIRHPVSGGDACSVFRVAEGTIRDILGACDPAAAEAEHPRLPLTQSHLRGQEYLLHRLAFGAAARDADAVETEESALWFLHAVLTFAHARRHAERAPTSPAKSPSSLATAVEYAARVHHVISQRFAGELTLGEIGRAVHCSPFHVSRLVTSATGVPIHRLLVRFRLRHALEYVLDTERSLSGIAFATGFSSHSHFTDAFRREFGFAPHHVRRRSARELGAHLARLARQTDSLEQRPAL